MTVLFLIESIFEFICLLTALIFLFIARSPGEHGEITPRFLKRKKYVGFAIVAIFMTMLFNYGYIVFRFFQPASPYEFIERIPLPDNCVKIIR